MASSMQPLVNSQPIVNPDGTPTQYFMRWAQERQIDISEGITQQEAQQLIADFAADRDIHAGVGLDGGGPLSSDVTIDLSNTAVAAGLYGTANAIPRINIDPQGRIIAASEVPVRRELPAGGTTGQVLAKASATSYDVTWVNQSGGGGGGGKINESWPGRNANTGAFGSRGGLFICEFDTTLESLYFQFSPENGASYIASIVILSASNVVQSIVSQVTVSGLTVGLNRVYKFTFPGVVALAAGARYGFVLTRTVVSGSASWTMAGTTSTGQLPNFGYADITRYIRTTLNTIAVGQTFAEGANSYWWGAERSL